MQNSNAILDNIKSRRSVRKFLLDKEIEKEKLDLIFEAAKWSPTNCNKQLWKIIVIKSNEVKNRLVKEAGSSTLILKAPLVLAVIHYDDVYLEAFQTTAIVTQNIMLMANELGLGTLFLNSKGNADKIKKILNIPEKYIVTNFILLGYYDKNKRHTPPKRKRIEEFISYENFQGLSEINWSHDPAKWNYKSLKEYQTYISRKTQMGTKQDIFDEDEVELVKNISKNYNKHNHLELFSYDGWILKGYINDMKNLSVAETSEETILYSQETLEGNNIKGYIFEEIEQSELTFDSISLNFRLERLPDDTKQRVWDFARKHLVKDGTLHIVFRNDNIFFKLFYKLLIKKMGDNISKTAIFAFFGPYKPLSHDKILQELKDEGFEIEGKKFMPFPPIFRTIARLMYQYKLSKGGNFMHRIDKETKLSKFFGAINRLQNRFDLNFYGSISYIKCKKI